MDEPKTISGEQLLRAAGLLEEDRQRRLFSIEMLTVIAGGVLIGAALAAALLFDWSHKDLLLGFGAGALQVLIGGYAKVRLGSIDKKLAHMLITLGNADESREREAALSLGFLEKTQRDSAKAKSFLSVAAMFFIGLYLLAPQIESFPASIACIFTLMLLQIRDSILEFRIRKGYFGSNIAEARDFLHYLLDNKDTIDFNDDSGAPKKALIPYPVNDANERGLSINSGSAPV